MTTKKEKTELNLELVEKKMEFITLEKEDYPELKRWILERPTMLSESNFAYHILWNDYYESKYCFLKKGILCLIKEKKNEIWAMPPITKLENIKELFEQLQTYFTKILHKPLQMTLVDEEVICILNLSKERYEIIDDTEENGDYIYRGESMRTLSGNKLHRKKTQVNNFKKLYGKNYEYRKLSPETAEEFSLFLDQWQTRKEREDPNKLLPSEAIGLKKAFSMIEESELHVAGIALDGELRAFAVGSYNKAMDMVVMHAEKADISIRGMYAFMDWQFLIREFPNAFYVNREEDMGIEGIRKAKQGYAPLYKTKKYRIIEKVADKT